MRWKPSIWLALTCLFVGYVLTRFAADRFDMSLAVRSGTSAAYRRYLNDHKGVGAVKRAGRGWDDRLAEEAAAIGTVQALNYYIARSPIKAHESKIQPALDDARFREAVWHRSTRRLRGYVGRRPHRRHLAEAKALLDDLFFDEVMTEDSFGAVYKYLREFPDGRHAEVAHGLISKLTKRRLDAYKGEARKRGGYRSAVRAILSMGDYMAKTGDFTLHIVYAQKNRSSVSEIREQDLSGRQATITSIVNNAFARIFHESVVNVTAGSSPSNDALRLYVTYSIRDSGSTYRASRMAFMTFKGILVRWNFKLVVPRRTTYRFTFNTEPADHFTVEYTSFSGLDAGPSRSEVYKAMVKTAFTDFTDVVVKRFGFQAEDG